MKIFSDELNMQALIKNTQLGFRVLIDEWYWLILQISHTYKIKQIENELNSTLDEEIRSTLSQKIESLNKNNLEFRELQIQSRIKAYL